MANVHTEKVVGVSFRQNNLKLAYFDSVNDTCLVPCDLVPEPNNIYDPNALAVMVNDKTLGPLHVGYIRAELAKEVTGQMIEHQLPRLLGAIQIKRYPNPLYRGGWDNEPTHKYSATVSFVTPE